MDVRADHTHAEQRSAALDALAAAHRGRGALDDILPEVYADLRRLASRSLRHERAGHTLETTALVHEAYLRLAQQREVDLDDRAHFFALAAHAIRRILVDHARRRGARERRERLLVTSGGEPASTEAAPAIDLLALDEALLRLAQLSERQAKVIELRFFGGLSVDDAARVLGVSPRTVDGEWSVARAWLARELRGERRA